MNLSNISFFQKLEERVKNANTLLCIGLDPHISQLPNNATAKDAELFCVNIIKQTVSYAAAYKPNIAFFESFGSEGITALIQTISIIPSDIPIILDCKRGDIDTTAQAYATSAYDIIHADAVTLSPYMGWDSIKPFVTNLYEKKGAFVLCKTSNQTSKEIQELTLFSNDKVYEHIAKLSNNWNKACANVSIGLVVGATDLIALKNIRQLVPDIWILCPGVGAQGGDSQSVCNVGLRADGSGLLVSVSRSISNASNISQAAETLRDEINLIRAQYLSSKISNHDKLCNIQQEFISFALSKNVLKFGEYKLKSGRLSPYFFNAGLFNCGESMSLLGRFYAQTIREVGIEFDVIFGPAYKGIPLATAISMAWYHLYNESKDVTYNRKEVKDHGEGGTLVGANITNRRVMIVDDVITAGTAIRESVELLESQNAILASVVVSLDRQEKVFENVNESAVQQVSHLYDVPIISIVRLNDLISFIQNSNSNNELLTYLPAIREYRDRYGVDYY